MSKKSNDILNFLLAVLAIVLIIVTLGVLYSETEQKKEIAEPEPDPLKDLEDELQRVNSSITELEPQRSQLESRERKLFLWARITIGVLIVGGNVAWVWCHQWKFDLGDQLNINSAGLLLYGFVAYILYGSIDKFTKSIKSSAINYLRKKHIHIWEELKRLREYRVVLETEIEKLKQSKL